MTAVTFGRSGYGKYLKRVLLLSLIFILALNSILLAGPMGDPEPIGENDQTPIGAMGDSQPSNETSTSSLLDIELAIIALSVLL
jgi:hypothetical protein